jgi:hypothetical protein
MSHVKAKRSRRITVETEIQIVSHRICTESLDSKGSGYLWIELKRTCCVCGKRFAHGDSVSLCMYIEDGQQLSGGVHTGCLPPDAPEAANA